MVFIISAILLQFMKVLLLDNFDSFTYNLYHYLQPLCAQVVVKRNQQVSLREVEAYSHIVVSPGPGLPQQAGLTLPIIKKYAATKAILGVCLGAQALAEHFGATLYNQNEVAHGICRTAVRQGPSWLLAGVPQSFKVGLYHSWAIQTQPSFLKHFYPTALRDESTLMAFEHATLPLAGVQFHPESIMSEGGKIILENWLRKC
jgi:anthranilate synthase component 2